MFYKAVNTINRQTMFKNTSLEKIFYKILTIILLSNLFYPNNITFAQDSLKYKLNNIIVTSKKSPFFYLEISRSIELINNNDFSKIPVSTPGDLLNYANSVDLRQRGINSIQGDVGIRGGSFEQTLIMIDGIKIIDPQTGHYNMNLPLTLNNISRVEIVKGSTSSFYGPNAFSGVINFVTKRKRTNSLSLQTEGGANGYVLGSVFGSLNLWGVSNNIAFEKIKSDGYRNNTEYNITTFSYGGAFVGTNFLTDIFFGYNNKKFGANSFYTRRFPLQAEHTKTKFLKISTLINNGNFNTSVKAYWRRNDDEFVLIKTNPAFYKNIHQTNVYGFQIKEDISSRIGKTFLGGEYVYDKIKSNNLGIHNRHKRGVFIEQQFQKFSKFKIKVSGYAYNYSSIGWRLWPGFEIGYELSNKLNIFGNMGKAFRIPTYTELYYHDPVTQGNRLLKYEESLSYELGINFQNSNLSINSSFFRREEKNRIDWVRLSESAPWRAMNISSVNTTGFELNFRIDLHKSFMNIRLFGNNPLFNMISVKYTYLNSDKKNSRFMSRYLLEYLKHQLIISIGQSVWGNTNINWFIRYEDRLNVENHFLVDLNINKKISSYNVYVKGTNLFNTPHFDIVGVPLPGRQLIAGIKYSLK